MRKGWEVKELAVVSAINYGYTDSASSEPIGPRFLRITDIQNDRVDWESVPYCRIESADIPKYRLASGDIVFARTGATTGKSFLVNNPPDAVFASYLIRLRLLEKRLLPEFVSLFFQTAGYWQSIKDGSSGSAQGGFNATKLGALSIPIPSLPEQQRIVGLLDEAFAGIATAKVNAEKNLQNARAIFESHLQSVFTQRGKGWKQKTLAEIATTFGRGKSKHRPRNAPHLYGGKYPFVQTGDIRNADHIITEYSQTYSEAGLAQSKLWPKGTICITIAANIAETAILGFEACFPDSVIGVVANPKEAEVGFIEYLLQSFKARIQAMGKGSAQANINIGTFENERFPFPSVAEQRHIVGKLDDLSKETQRLANLYQRKLAALDELKKSLLHQAFTGELTKEFSSVIIPFPAIVPNITPTDLHAGILAIGYEFHETANRLQFYGHVKAEKISHMMEALVGIDLGRLPVQDAAGPNDFPHLKRVEHRARMAGFFNFKEQAGAGYRMMKGRNFDALISRVRAALGELNTKVDNLINLMLPLDMQQAEVFATVYAAWNNLLMEGDSPTDEQIVVAARENWHPDKLNIPRDKFFKTIGWIRKKNICPEGKGKKVAARAG